MEIRTYPFNANSIELVLNSNFGENWPVVYILENKPKAYVGESNHVSRRLKEHLKDSYKRKLYNKAHVINDKKFNKSAIYDIESKLIEYMSADKFKLKNVAKGFKNYNYYNKTYYKTIFEQIWDELIKLKLVTTSLFDLRNSDLFKYSPYKSLTPDQSSIVEKLKNNIRNKEKSTNIVYGKAGTGKSVIATYLVKNLVDNTKDFSNLKIGVVVAMTSFRNTLKKVFRNVEGLSSSMVIGPSEVIKHNYDLLIVDEAHRLKKRTALVGGEYASFDKINKKLGLESGSQLDWIFKSSKHQILLYDPSQSIRPSDISKKEFEQIDSLSQENIFELKSQWRVKGGNKYIEFIDNLLNNRNFSLENNQKYSFNKYECKIYTDIEKMVKDIKNKNNLSQNKDNPYGLARILAGYAWDWKSKNNKEYYDIIIDNTKLKWNSVSNDWVNSENSINEVGCIHTIQGYDLNYAGVIIGPELSYDFNKKEFVIYKDKYKDKKGKEKIKDLKTLKRYILNIYYVLLTRGIYGTYIYICDKNLRKYFESFIDVIY
jgi:hypothetical protein